MFGPIKNVIFDLEGTLINSLKTVVKGIVESVEVGSGQRPDPGMLPLGRSPEMIIRDLVPPTLWEKALAHWADFESRLDEKTEVYAGVEELLDFLSDSKIFLGIYTSRDRAGTEQILLSKGWIPKYFSVERIRCGDDPGGRKPSPAPINDLCERYGLEKKHTLMVGDNATDAAAAGAAGILFGAALWDLPGTDQQTFRSRYAGVWNKWNGIELQFRLPSPLSLKEYFLSKAPVMDENQS